MPHTRFRRDSWVVTSSTSSAVPSISMRSTSDQQWAKLALLVETAQDVWGAL